MSFFGELKRRSVFRMGVFYLLGAWVVLQIVDVLVGVIGLPDWTLRLVGLVLLLGLPLVLVLSWVYELTPEGLKKDDTVDESGRQVAVTPQQRIILVASFAVILVGGYLLIDNLVPETTVTKIDAESLAPGELPPPHQARLAVRPFRVVGEPPDGETGPDVEAWVRWLGKRFPDIDIIPAERTGKSQNMSLAEAADELLATHVMTGEYRFEGDALWERIELFDVDREERIWAWVSDTPVEIAGEGNPDEESRAEFELTHALANNGLTAHRLETDNLQAYLALERATHESDWRPGRNDEAIRWFQEAILLEPAFAEAHARFGEFWARQSTMGDLSTEPRKYALEHARLAVELNPDNPAAQAAMSLALFVEARWGSESESQAREANLRDALEFTRTAVRLAYYDPEIRMRYLSLLRVSALDRTEPCDGGCWEEVLDQLRIMHRNDATDPILVCLMLEPLSHLNQLDKASQRFDELPGDVPQYCEGYIHLFHRARGEFRLALETLHPAMVDGRLGTSHFYYFALLDVGAPEAVLAWADHLMGRLGVPARSYAAIPMREANLALGRFETALSWSNSQTVRAEEARLRFATFSRFHQLGTLTPDDPNAIAHSAVLDKDCDAFEAKFSTPEGYVIPLRETDIATACLLHSISQGRPRERLVEELPRVLEERKPYRGIQRDPGPLWKTLVQAALGDSEAALDTFRSYVENGFSRLDWLQLWRAHGGPGDLTNGLSSHPEFRALVDEIEARNAAILTDIEANAPWLLDPGIPKPEPEAVTETVASD
jgi:tetratricopeptide (TPR) repeat protein